MNRMQDVLKELETLSEDDLAIFDLDMVVMQPEDPAFQMANMKRFSPICKKVIQLVPEKKRDIFLALITISSGSVLIDPETPNVLHHLAENSVPTIALTGSFTGKLAHIEEMEVCKVKRLKEMGIDFSQAAPHSEKIVFRDLPASRGSYPIYIHGVLFTNGSDLPKGEALIEFFKITGTKPKKIVFIDDREDNVKNLEAFLQKFHPEIEYLGLVFTGAREYPSPPITEQQFEARWQEIASQANKYE